MINLSVLAEAKRIALKAAFESKYPMLLPLLVVSDITYQIDVKERDNHLSRSISFLFNRNGADSEKAMSLSENGSILRNDIQLSSEELTALLAEWTLEQKRKEEAEISSKKRVKGEFDLISTLLFLFGGVLFILGIILNFGALWSAGSFLLIQGVIVRVAVKVAL